MSKQTKNRVENIQYQNEIKTKEINELLEMIDVMKNEILKKEKIIKKLINEVNLLTTC
jgi:negative regulator of sigma E activity